MKVEASGAIPNARCNNPEERGSCDRFSNLTLEFFDSEYLPWLFGAESFAFEVAIQTFKDQDI